MLWILTPLLLATLFMEFYFERYSQEELGWNTAFGNTLVLLFVSIDLIRHLHNNALISANPKFAIVIAVVFVGTVVTLLDFFHALPKSLAFVVSSKLPINCLALAAVLFVYTTLPLDFATYAALILLVIVLFVLIKLLSIVVPTHDEEE